MQSPRALKVKCVFVCVLLFGVYLCVRMVPQDPKGIVKPTLLCLSLCAKWVVEQHRGTKKKKNQTQISHAKLNNSQQMNKCDWVLSEHATRKCQMEMQFSSPLTLHIDR